MEIEDQDIQQSSGQATRAEVLTRRQVHTAAGREIVFTHLQAMYSETFIDIKNTDTEKRRSRVEYMPLPISGECVDVASSVSQNNAVVEVSFP